MGGFRDGWEDYGKDIKTIARMGRLLEGRKHSIKEVGGGLLEVLENCGKVDR